MSEHNIISDRDSALLAMAAIEDKYGDDGWLSSQLKAIAELDGVYLGNGPDSLPEGLYDSVNYTIGAAIIEVEGNLVKPADWDQADWADRLQSIACIVYGSCGWNRWGVCYSGEVIFSSYHGRSDLEKAHAAGFRSW